ncbi:MAG TPA: hypothetical protein VNP97_12735, partial [Microbacterium sp.]|nr:hypothetical protein [Microbacterium sp.]
MVVPAEQNAIVGVRRAAARVLVHVVKLAPTRAHVASGDHTPTVTERDREPLMMVEHPVRGLDRDDATAIVGDHSLYGAAAGDLSCDRDRHGLFATLDVSEPAIIREVFRPDRDDKCR